MAAADERKDKRSEEGQPPSTANFSGPAKGPGSQIGRFRIEQELGRGGMGVVYLAHDTNLDRPVAIKSLPPQIAENTELLSRLKREAKILASLNHPNIATIHEEVQKDGVGYLVLEYIAGDTLAERMSRGALALEEALSIGLQVAEALSAAHSQSVIHRDLKPSNIKITPDNNVKVLDFGIAKAVKPEKPDGESSLTKTGRIIGTPAYMSPEQVRAEPVDHRSDIWSFGCVLYVMLTGKVPFKDKTSSDMVANILKDEPDWQAVPETTPANIRVLLRRCLEKDRQRRLQHAGDAALEIRETLNLPAIAPPVGRVVPDGSRSTRWALLYGLAGVLIGAVAAAIIFSSYLRPAPPEKPSTLTRRMVITLPENQTLALSRSTPLGIAQPALALSPDGSRLVYVANLDDTTQLFLRMMNELQAKAIPGTEGGFTPFFSPDGKSIGFFTRDKLKTLSLLGGQSAALCDARNPKGACWGPDGMIYFAEREGGLLSRVPATGGPSEHLVAKAQPAGPDSFGYGHPQLLPDGRHLLLSSMSSVTIFSLETRQKTALVKNGQHARCVPTGHIAYAWAGAIHAAPFSLTTLRLTGPSVPVLDVVMLDSSQGTAQFSFASEGSLVYVPGGDTATSIPAWVDRQGNVKPFAMPARVYGAFKLSPDGTRLAMQLREGAQSDIYIYDLARGVRTRLTWQGQNYGPLWTPDGKRVVFSCYREDLARRELSWKPVDGSGEAESLHSSQYRSFPYSWSPNGTRLAFTERNPTTGDDIRILRLEGARETELAVGTEFHEWGPAFSPDGRWLAYTSDKDGKYQVYVQPYPAGDKIWQISTDSGEEPIWSPKGDELYYRNGDKWMVVAIVTEPEFSAGTPQVLFEGPYLNVPGLSYDVSPDGQRFLVLQPQYDDSQVRELHVVTNWFDELKRLAPTGKNK